LLLISKSNRRTLSELDKNPLIKMMSQDSRSSISGFLSYGDRVVEVFWADVFIDLCSSIPPVST
jgi:hypothetical protein